MTRVLLGQMNANGDCLYATILARQFKADHPGCHLTWAVSRRCVPVLRNNPDIDALWVWDVPADGPLADEKAWWAFQDAALRRQQGPDAFDRICLSQIWPGNFRRYDGTVRTSILRAYGKPITVPIDSTIRLAADEEERVAAFAREAGLDAAGHRILFECASNSGQSFVTAAFALEVSRLIAARLPDCRIVLSTHAAAPTDLPQVVWAAGLGIRENAALTRHCDLFIGCGSGVTVAATSGAAAALPNIQLLRAATSVYASFAHDFEHFGKPADRFIEMGDPDAATVAAAAIACLTEGPAAARARWGRPLPVAFGFYAELIETWCLKPNRACDALDSLSVTIDRYGPRAELLRFGRERVLPALRDDPSWRDPERRRRLEPIRDRVASATALDEDAAELHPAGGAAEEMASP